MSRRTAAALVAALALTTAAAGCGSDDDGGSDGGGAATTGSASTAQAPQDAQATDKVDIKDFKYGPQDVTVKAGGSITWTNDDSAPHTATLNDGAGKFDTGTLEQGKSKKVRFATPGTYSYICVFHPYMKGTVTVTK